MESKVIHNGKSYQACEMSDGSLIVSSKRIQKGVRLVGELANLWILSILEENEIDIRESLCKVVINS